MLCLGGGDDYKKKKKKHEISIDAKDMDLRDYFAGQALLLMTEYFKNEKAYKMMSKHAYDIADAMMKERDK